MKRLALLVFLIVLGVHVALAADVTGTWTAQTPARNGGTDTTTFQFRVDGKALAGTVRMAGNDYAIKEGTTDGETVRFHVTVNIGREVKFVHTGTVAGEEIRFVRELQGLGRKSTFVAKRSK
jgi:hypothetical protein